MISCRELPLAVIFKKSLEWSLVRNSIVSASKKRRPRRGSRSSAVRRSFVRASSSNSSNSSKSRDASPLRSPLKTPLKTPLISPRVGSNDVFVFETGQKQMPKPTDPKTPRLADLQAAKPNGLQTSKSTRPTAEKTKVISIVKKTGISELSAIPRIQLPEQVAQEDEEDTRRSSMLSTASDSDALSSASPLAKEAANFSSSCSFGRLSQDFQSMEVAGDKNAAEFLPSKRDSFPSPNRLAIDRGAGQRTGEHGAANNEGGPPRKLLDKRLSLQLPKMPNLRTRVPVSPLARCNSLDNI